MALYGAVRGVGVVSVAWCGHGLGGRRMIESGELFHFRYSDAWLSRAGRLSYAISYRFCLKFT